MRWALLLVLAAGCDAPKPAAAPQVSPASTEALALFERASHLAPTDPKAALELFREVVTRAPAGDPLRAQAIAQVAQLTSTPDTNGVEGHGGVAAPVPVAPVPAPLVGPSEAELRDLYLRGYQLKTSDPQGAIAAFERIVAMTPATDELHQKAQRRLAELSPLRALEDDYQRAYMIREHEPAEALKIFQRVAAEAPRGSALQQRAEAEAKKLAP